jgi:hypothetical protein
VKYTTAYEARKVTDGIKVRCTVCQKMRSKSITKTYYKNGLHDEAETRQRLAVKIKADLEKIADPENQFVCNSCLLSNEDTRTVEEVLQVGDELAISLWVMHRVTEVHSKGFCAAEVPPMTTDARAKYSNKPMPAWFTSRTKRWSDLAKDFGIQQVYRKGKIVWRAEVSG